jgi:hypothetical protein
LFIKFTAILGFSGSMPAEFTTAGFRLGLIGAESRFITVRGIAVRWKPVLECTRPLMLMVEGLLRALLFLMGFGGGLACGTARCAVNLLNMLF